MIKEQNQPRQTELQATKQSELKIIKFLASGASGQVHLGEWNNKSVAIKHLTRATEEGKDEFLREMRVMFKCNGHPNLVQLFSVCMESNYFAMIMEYMEKGSLKKVLSDSKYPMPWNERYRIIIEISHGIEFLHKNKIVHADIKTDNILLDI